MLRESSAPRLDDEDFVPDTDRSMAILQYLVAMIALVAALALSLAAR